MVRILVRDGTVLAQDSLKEFRGDREFLLAAAQDNFQVGMSVAEFASNALKEDRTFWIQLMGTGCSGFCLKFAPKTFLEDRDFMGQALRISISSLWREDICEEACKQMCQDRDFVLALLKDGVNVFKFIELGGPFENDRELMMLSVRLCPETIPAASEELRDDREIVEAALQERMGHLVRHASERLRADRDIGLLAARMNGNPFDEPGMPPRYPQNMPDDAHVVSYLSEELKNDREIVLEAVRKAGSNLWFAPGKFHNDREMMLEAIRTFPRVLELAGDALKGDRDFALDAIRMNGDCLEYLEVDKYENSQELVQAAKA